MIRPFCARHLRVTVSLDGQPLDCPLNRPGTKSALPAEAYMDPLVVVPRLRLASPKPSDPLSDFFLFKVIRAFASLARFFTRGKGGAADVKVRALSDQRSPYDE
jgi:hypothetical protein